MKREHMARGLLRLAERLTAGKDYDDTVKKLYYSKDPGIVNVSRLLYSIWNLERTNWREARKELLKYPSGRMIVKRMEALPAFKEIQKGYWKYMNTISREEKKKIDDEWEDFEFGVLRPVVDKEMMDYYMKHGVD